MNYERIYKIRSYEQAIYDAHRKIDKAKQDLTNAKEQFLKQCAKISGLSINELYVSNYSCCADGVSCHVHHKKYSYQHHENKCIFCGIDDVDTI